MLTSARDFAAQAGAEPKQVDRLEQALQNLAANAIRHTPDGGEVRLVAEPAGDRVRITVTDTGPGIPAEHLPHIFDRFYKADAARARIRWVTSRCAATA